MDDMNSYYLSDRSLYRQVMDKLDNKETQGKPIFNYILTYSGHWDYQLNTNRPKFIKHRSNIKEAGDYANSAYYQSKELIEFVKNLRAKDPDAIIIAFGDHLPYLGSNFAAYVESGILAKDFTSFTDPMYLVYVSTPLLVIDGRNGPLQIGHISMYQLPSLVLDLLGYDRPTIFNYATTAPSIKVRPLLGMHINLMHDNKLVVCKQQNIPAICVDSSRWLRDLFTVSSDIFMGNQYTLPLPISNSQ